ncbi:proline iminopeptidase [Streptomyces sulfonofaciens]|uniref:Proline iminopeptidase n=1 Tax=Streptomyces sulfonofaciens TaxID=68272 RepID=A0A919FU95_9ACTN|nr:alpha/beta fold hydrolase [Streptomyces sulfonofaciens]GHH71914.1 proline iminopeptidase [Streptomyces sulfonofaciens]
MITAEYTLPGVHVRDHRVPVPLDWAADSGPELSLFARELVDPARRGEDLPCLLYLQGGPGGKSPRPLGPADGGWIGPALREFRVVLLDQRGTGRSSPVDGRVMRGFDSGARGADFLCCFRADSIVADAEHLRRTSFGGRPWITLGTSYGGFLTLTYLSLAPEGLAGCLVAGGLAAIRPSVEEVYRRTYPRVAAKNRVFQRRYPADAEVLHRVADLLSTGDVRLPDGDALTVRRLQVLGLDFGMKPGFERVHWIFDEAFADEARERLTDTFLGEVRSRTSFADRPLFTVLQESIFCSGPGAPPAWAAERERARHPEFAADARPLLLTGEMIYPWMFEEIGPLRPFAPAAEELAAREEWSHLYAPDRLAANEVPVAAVVYHDDMYVDAGLQLETAAAVGNVHTWVTNEFEHDGLHEDGRVFTRLVGLLREAGHLPAPR